MKRTLITAMIAVGTVAIATGCNSIYSAFKTTPDEVHDIAVQKVSDYAEAAVNKKIDNTDELTEEGKAKLKAEVAQLKAEILAKIAEIKAKTDAAKAEKTANAAEKVVETEQK